MGEFALVTRAYDGQGIMKYATGDIYEGRWKNGIMHGTGRMMYAKIFDDSDEEDGEEPSKPPVFFGQFVDGKKVEGTLVYENGDSFTGEFTEDGLRDSGCLSFKNGDEFAGLFEGGAIKSGTMTTKDTGDEYSGEFLDAVYHGSGKLTYANGDVFAGEF